MPEKFSFWVKSGSNSKFILVLKHIKANFKPETVKVGG